MSQTPTVLALIPARGGSKGLPGKNVKPLAGHPLLAYSIKAGQEATLVNRTLVTTDSKNIAEVARQYKAEVPFLRPAEISGDFANDLSFWHHALEWLATKENYRPDYVVQLRPTSPVRPRDLIDRGIQKLLETGGDSLRVVTPAPQTPYKMWRIAEGEKSMHPLLNLSGTPEPYNEPRQSLPPVYWQIGTLDVIKTTVITEQNSLSGRHIIPFVLEEKYAVDIDTEKDFNRAAEVIQRADCIKFDE